ncbi:YdeI/OmpD-associated family protein [Staphylococcus pasteuri]|uniref:YdeI/OmpD-associated family protein n=1 Tax=Staphylococcus pasteuri TaxID=45972 RepID=UPI0039AEBDD7
MSSQKNINADVEAFLKKDSQCKDEFNYLRETIVNFDDLEETMKWMHPCYTINNKNVVLIHGFKEYVAVMFFKGALIEDSYNTLIQQTKNVQSARQLRFEKLEDIQSRKEEIIDYVKQAIDIEKAGKEVKLKKTEDYEVPDELQQQFDKMTELKEAFKQLTPGRQRQYLHHIGEAKRADTRQKRVDKYINHILEGKGMHDK